jgi:LPXTG-site transpeptidase (sortase) family protein
MRRLITLVLAGVISLVAIIGFAAVTVFSGGDVAPRPAMAHQEQPPAPSTPEPVAAQQAPPAPKPAGQPPGTIRLPQGGTAELVRGEIDRTGTLPIPNGVDEATWWGAGLDAPTGATVLAGHVNWKGAVGPFAELWKSAQGQQVTVLDAGGRTFEYKITDVVTVHKNDLPRRAAELFGQGGEHRLVLVTCGGRYIGGDTGYDENRIVVATPAA